jgi:hypothetical protein
MKDCLSGAVLSGADLSGAYLSGADLSGAYLRYADLSDAVLSGADLSDADLRNADLSGAYLRNADLSGADLSDAYLRNAVLSGAVLRDADLSGADLSGVPEIKNIHQTIYEAVSKPDALDMSTWHKCETTHCRAGWVIALAGEAGAAMEFCMGTPTAAALIYLKSDPKIEKIPNFYADNADALADMKRLAELEATATKQI